MSNNPKLRKNGGKGTAVGNALRWLASQGKPISAGLLDMAGSITGIESLEKLSDAIAGNTVMTKEDKDYLLKQVEFDMQEMEEVTKRWQSDMSSDNKLSKNIRPLTLAFLTLTLFVYIILDSSIAGFKIDKHWVDLLRTLLVVVYGGYFGARTIEKVYNRNN